MPRPFRILPLLLFLALPTLRAQVPYADGALREGRVELAAGLLRSWLAQHPSDAGAHLLLCRAFYAQEKADPAISECEAAAINAPTSSEAQLWLGRAYGMKASSAGALSAFSLARKVRDAFERSVHLDPTNLSASGDLGEFYVAAPAIGGGGSGKARRLAATLHSRNQPPAEAQSHRILALLAEKNNDQTTAEMEFRQATQASLREVWNSAAWIDLGAFYARHHQPDRVLSAVRFGVAADILRSPTLVDAASVLTEAGRDPDLARDLLRQYLASPAKSDAAPAFKVHLQLGDLLTRSGDLASARREYAAALALAPNFPPARNLASASPKPANQLR